MDAASFRKHLTQDIIPFWNACKDGERGGFCGSVGHDLRKDWQSDKGVILHSRILWFYSSAYCLLKNRELLEMADHAYTFLRDCCLDREFGGMYWSVTSGGQPADDTKHTYNQAFAVYALSAYYEASNREAALEMARGLYRLIEEKCRDREGYLEAFHRDFSPASNEKLSENGVMAARTMNTLLHVMEAYTELYRVAAERKVRDSLCEILRIFCDKVYNAGKGSCEVFFDGEYHSLIDLESYGHNIEAAWLLERAVQVLSDEAWESRLRPVIAGLSETAYEHAFDAAWGCFYNEREGERIDRQRIWWVQGEAVTGFYNAYQAEPGHTEYLQASEAVWRYIREHLVDRRSGEWFESVKEDGSVDERQGLVHAWKCPYHNGRMCIEMIRRLEGETGPANPRATEGARKLLGFLHRVAGKRIITGQHTQTRSMEEISYLRKLTGREPLLRGFELLAYSPNICYEDASEACLDEVYANRGTLETALQWGREKRGIVELTFHWFSPLGGRDKSFYAENTDFDAERILREDTSERAAFHRDLEVVAKLLKRFQEEGIPVLWRPFHEADGTWFWWGAKGPAVARQLYRMMFDYFTVECGLDNLIWVWSCSAREGYPGDARVDVVSADIYLQEYAATDYGEEYQRLVAATSRKKVAALAEVGYLPDVAKLKASRVPWAYYMTWSKEFCIGEQYNTAEKVLELYGSDYAVTLPSNG